MFVKQPCQSPNCVPEEAQAGFPSPNVKVWRDKVCLSSDEVLSLGPQMTVPLWDKSQEPTHSGHRERPRENIKLLLAP